MTHTTDEWNRIKALPAMGTLIEEITVTHITWGAAPTTWCGLDRNTVATVGTHFEPSPFPPSCPACVKAGSLAPVAY